MMRALVIIIGIAAIAAIAYFRAGSRVEMTSAVAASSEGAPVAVVSVSKPVVAAVPRALAPAPARELEKESLETLSTLVADEGRERFTPAEMIKRLAVSGYQPVASRDHDEIMGSMITIETKNALPGSRYFRAQYFSDETGAYEAQHISVEFKPGTPIPEILRSLEAKIGQLKTTPLNSSDEKLLKTADGRSLYIKRLDDTDIQESAIHAYSPEDRGTIFVSLERSIPGHEADDFED